MKTIKILYKEFDGTIIDKPIDAKWVGKYLALYRHNNYKVRCYVLTHLKTGYEITKIFNSYKIAEQMAIELDQNEFWNFGEWGKPGLSSEQIKQMANILLEVMNKYQ